VVSGLSLNSPQKLLDTPNQPAPRNPDPRSLFSSKPSLSLESKANTSNVFSKFASNKNNGTDESKLNKMEVDYSINDQQNAKRKLTNQVK
jgi:hypothetical protein